MSVNQLQMMWAFVEAHASRLSVRAGGERGSATLEKVVLTAILVAAAVAGGTIIYNLTVGKANAIDTTTPY